MTKTSDLIKLGSQVDLLHKYCHSNSDPNGDKTTMNFELCYYSCTNMWQAAVFGGRIAKEILCDGDSPQEAMDELMKKLCIGGPEWKP